MNYVREKSKETPGQALNTQSKEDFADDKYLKPALEDDAVLFSIDDLDGEQHENSVDKQQGAPVNGDSHASDTQQYLTRIAQLERALEQSREAFMKERGSGDEPPSGPPRARKQVDEQNRFYFNSYSFRGM